jgi:hypothetical protein
MRSALLSFANQVNTHLVLDTFVIFTILGILSLFGVFVLAFLVGSVRSVGFLGSIFIVRCLRFFTIVSAILRLPLALFVILWFLFFLLLMSFAVRFAVRIAVLSMAVGSIWGTLEEVPGGWNGYRDSSGGPVTMTSSSGKNPWQ